MELLLLGVSAIMFAFFIVFSKLNYLIRLQEGQGTLLTQTSLRLANHGSSMFSGFNALAVELLKAHLERHGEEPGNIEHHVAELTHFSHGEPIECLMASIGLPGLRKAILEDLRGRGDLIEDIEEICGLVSDYLWGITDPHEICEMLTLPPKEVATRIWTLAENRAAGYADNDAVAVGD